jgi:hypothetical protein
MGEALRQLFLRTGKIEEFLISPDDLVNLGHPFPAQSPPRAFLRSPVALQYLHELHREGCHEFFPIDGYQHAASAGEWQSSQADGEPLRVDP